MIQGKKVASILLVVLVSIILTIAFFKPLIQTAYAQASISDNALNVEAAVEGFASPTSMVFLDDNNILVLEKEGSIRLVSNGILQEQPILQVPVNAENERGLLGVALSNGSNGNQGTANTDVFLYYTEEDPLRNRIYKYQWNGETLINPSLILDLPAEPGPNHDGGKIIIGPDGYLYAVLGDLNHDGQLQNFPDGPPPDDTGSIVRINPADGAAPTDNPCIGRGTAVLNKF